MELGCFFSHLVEELISDLCHLKGDEVDVVHITKIKFVFNEWYIRNWLYTTLSFKDYYDRYDQACKRPNKFSDLYIDKESKPSEPVEISTILEDLNKLLYQIMIHRMTIVMFYPLAVGQYSADDTVAIITDIEEKMRLVKNDEYSIKDLIDDMYDVMIGYTIFEDSIMSYKHYLARYFRLILTEAGFSLKKEVKTDFELKPEREPLPYVFSTEGYGTGLLLNNFILN